MGAIAPVLGLVLSAVSTFSQMSQAKDSAAQQEKAMQQQKAAADRTYQQGQEANNRANAKSPNTGVINAQNQVQAQQGGGGATMLSGPQGVDPKSLSLAKNTVLGS